DDGQHRRRAHAVKHQRPRLVLEHHGCQRATAELTAEPIGRFGERSGASPRAHSARPPARAAVASVDSSGSPAASTRSPSRSVSTTARTPPTATNCSRQPFTSRPGALSVTGAVTTGTGAGAGAGAGAGSFASPDATGDGGGRRRRY